MADSKSKTIGSSLEETREFHRRYLLAINNPMRRRILRELKDGEATREALASRMGLDEKALEWHLGILEHGKCVEKETKDGPVSYKLTQEGRVVDYMDR